MARSSPSLTFSVLLLATTALIQQSSAAGLLPSNERNRAAISGPNGYDEKEEKAAMELLLKLVADENIKETHKNKRSCKVNLGGNCPTEDAISVADQWHFINSAQSPGRRRRRRRAAPGAFVQSSP